MDIKDHIKNLAANFHKEIIAVRNHLHANPELSYKEFNTSKYICSILSSLNIEFETGFVKTGIIGAVKGRNASKKTVAIRADMDALPIIEQNKVPYKSIHPGIMHACGHDVHIATVLGAAKILNELKDQFEGTVKLLFQPAEEKLPGGAFLMIQEGVLDLLNSSAIFSNHVMPSIDAGKVGFRAGMYMASADEIYITVIGKGGHAALPELNLNPIPIAAEIILELKKINPGDKSIPMVLSFGKISAEGATNVIPSEVKLEGTFRTMDEKWRVKAHQLITDKANTIAQSQGASCEVLIKKGYPCLINDEKLTKKARSFAEDYLGVENVETLDLRMTSDDFAYFSHAMPGCYYRLGVRNEAKGITSGVHTPNFNIDEKALETGMGLMAWIAVNELSG